MTSPSATAARGLIAEKFTARRSNTLRGFAKVMMPSGMIPHDVAIFVDAGRAWASPPSQPLLGHDRVALKDGPKIRYSPMVRLATKELRNKFSDPATEAARMGFSDALAAAS